MRMPSKAQLSEIGSGHHADPSYSLSLRAEAYTDPAWFAADQQEILRKSWQWVCHAEKVRAPGTYTTTQIADYPIAIVRDHKGVLRAFYNVCKHRAHPVLQGEGTVARIVCPYHAWRYRLDGQLAGAGATHVWTPADLRHQVKLEECRRQLPRVLSLPVRTQGLLYARRHDDLSGDDARHLFKSHGRCRKDTELRLRHLESESSHPRRMVALA